MALPSTNFLSEFFSLENLLRNIVPNAILVLVVVAIVLIIYEVLHFVVQRALRKSGQNEADIKVFMQLFRFGFAFLGVVFGIIAFSGSLTALGLSVGFFSLALGWALQKPITGVAAWLTIVGKKPFRIGDRIIIGDTKGDVVDITPFYIILNEFGGLADGDVASGRKILFPTSILFDQPIVNYTFDDEFVLSQVTVSITYESNLEKAKGICLQAAEETTKDILQDVIEKPYVRIAFKQSSIDLNIRFYSLALEREKTGSMITEKIFNAFSSEKDLEFAYPHTKIVFSEKQLTEFFEKKNNNAREKPIADKKRKAKGK